MQTSEGVESEGICVVMNKRREDLPSLSVSGWERVYRVHIYAYFIINYTRDEMSSCMESACVVNTCVLTESYKAWICQWCARLDEATFQTEFFLETNLNHFSSVNKFKNHKHKSVYWQGKSAFSLETEMQERKTAATHG